MSFAVSHTLGALVNRIDNIPNNLKEAISRTFMESYDTLKSELEMQFGDAIRYADFDLSFSGDTYSINITNLNEFVTIAQTGSDGSDITSFAESYMHQKIVDCLKRDIMGGA
jgi:hypothetical protein